MKKITSFLKPLAVAIALLAGANQAYAAPALAKFSPNNATFTNPGGAVVTITGLPAWFQGIDGVAVKPCLDVARCALVGAPDFNGGLPLSFPTNFPSEAFYFNATNASIPVGTASALVVLALEYTFVDALGNLVPASTPGAVGNPFQRTRLTHTFLGGGGVITPAPPAGSSFQVVTPWGTTVFPVAQAKCVNQGGDTKCTMTRDQPVAGPNPTAALGDPILAPGSISTFLKDPTAPAGFLGLGAAVIGFTGAPATGLNQITVIDPNGVSGTTTQLTTLTGQTVGLEITPPAAGTNFGPVSPVPPAPIAVPKTFIINNLTGVAPVLAITSSDPEFTIVPTGAIVAPATKLCGATMAIAEICNFYVTFTPDAVDGPKTATISIAGGVGVPTALATVTGTADSTPPAITLAAPFARVSTTKPSVINGTVEALAKVTVRGLPASVTPVPSTAVGTNTTWSFPFPATLPLSAGANPAMAIVATDLAGNTTTLNPSITGIVPDGILTANATTVSIADAQLALRFASGLSVPSPEQNIHADVAPLVGGKPTPNDKLDIGDVVLILRKVVAPTSWIAQ